MDKPAPWPTVGLPTELRLLLACLGLNPETGVIRQIGALSRSGINWPDFLALADRHRAAPLAHRNLREYGDNVPPVVLAALAARFQRNARRSLRNAAELVQVSMLFRENGLRCLPLKGSVLALQVYGSLEHRYAGDLDLLVEPFQVDAADRLLRRRCQRLLPGPHLTPGQLRQYYRLGEELVYYDHRADLRIELHTRLLYRRPLAALDLDRLQDRTRPVRLAQVSLPTLSPVATVLYLCDHGAQHAWSRLFWLADLAAIIRQRWITAWSPMLELAAEENVCRPLIQGVVLAHLLFRTPLPEPVRAAAGRDPVIPYLVQASLRRLMVPQETVGAVLYDNLMYQPRLCTDRAGKIAWLKHLLFFSRDWGARPWPDSLFPCFFLARPWLWLFRRLGLSGQKRDFCL